MRVLFRLFLRGDELCDSLNIARLMFSGGTIKGGVKKLVFGLHMVSECQELVVYNMFVSLK